MKDTWTAVDDYLERTLLPGDAALEAVLARNAAEGLPPIDVSPMHGQLLYLLTRATHAKRVLEIGTLGGYSTICFARGVGPAGMVVSLEVSEKHAKVARANINDAGVGEVVDIRVGAALSSLPVLDAEGIGPFDIVFIDADKPNNPPYFDWALRLSRVGSLILCDNVVRNGAVTDADSTDASVQGTRALFAAMQAEPRVSVTAIQTVGRKGYDGLAVALVTG